MEYDYEFGNRLHTERSNLCLSQDQLARLVDVTDKAVSKWETGAAKPRMATCIRLANVLGVSVEYLLTGKKESENAGLTREAAYKELQSLARICLTRKYGKEPPLECIGRLQSELDLLGNSNYSETVLLFRDIANKAHAQNCSVQGSGILNSWFVSWLLDCSNVNPLPPHYHCPKCHRTLFMYSYADGWDLPARECCGRLMVRDGHRIPLEVYAKTIAWSSIEITVTEGFEETAVEILNAHYKNRARLIPFIDEGVTYEEDMDRPKEYALIPTNDPVPQLNRDGIWITDFHEWINRHIDYERIIIWPSKEKRTIMRLKNQKQISISVDKLLAPVILEQKMREVIDLLPGLENAIKTEPIRFSSVLKAYALTRGTNTWIGNEELLINDGEVQFSDLIACREDVWETIVSHIKPDYSIGTGFPLKIMENARKGKYYVKGLDEDTVRLLLSLNLPAWFIYTISETKYIPPRAPMISKLFDELSIEYLNSSIGAI